MFLLLSFFTGILECGWIFRGLSLELPLWAILLFVAAYHLGNLFPLPFSLNRRALFSAGAAALLLAGASFLFRETTAALAAQGLGIFLDSAVIQSARSGMKSDGNRAVKRLCRVGGFLAAPLAMFCPSMIVAAGAVMGLLALRKVACGSAGVTRMTAQGGFSAVMLFHQLHYFLYAHITLALAASLYGVWAAAGFALTWIAYLSVEPALGKRISSPLRVFCAGHILIAVTLLLLAAAERSGYGILFAAAWITAGFGGGTVFTITRLNKSAGYFDKDSETIAENLGHTAGVLSAALCAFLIGNAAPAAMASAAAVSALCAIAAMTFIRRKTQCRSIQ